MLWLCLFRPHGLLGNSGVIWGLVAGEQQLQRRPQGPVSEGLGGWSKACVSIKPTRLTSAVLAEGRRGGVFVPAWSHPRLPEERLLRATVGTEVPALGAQMGIGGHTEVPSECMCPGSGGRRSCVLAAVPQP